MRRRNLVDRLLSQEDIGAKLREAFVSECRAHSGVRGRRFEGGKERTSRGRHWQHCCKMADKADEDTRRAAAGTEMVYRC